MKKLLLLSLLVLGGVSLSAQNDSIPEESIQSVSAVPLEILPTRFVDTLATYTPDYSNEGDELYMGRGRRASTFYMIEGFPMQKGLIPESEIVLEFPLELTGTPANQ